MLAKVFDSYKLLIPNTIKTAINAKRESHTKIPAKNLIIIIESNAKPNAIRAK
jgi:hypothetical protein